MPIVSGNVSLYNETDGKGILPTPTIGAVGILASLDQMIAGQPKDGDVAVLIGETRGHLGQSALLAEAFGIEAGDAPPVDLAAERKHGEFIRANHKAIAGLHRPVGWRAGIGGVRDGRGCGTGCGAGRRGISRRCSARIRRAIWWPAVPAQGAKLIARAAEAGVPAARVGQFGGNAVRFGTDEAPLKALSASYRGAFARAVA